MSKDDLGGRMKRDYENRTRFLLPRRTYTLIRMDGRSFHTYTRGLDRPFDTGLMENMNCTALALCEQIAGARFAFIQCDEISLLLTDFETPQTEAWFDLNLQKRASLSSSISTAAFNRQRLLRHCGSAETLNFAQFDSRVFQIPMPQEVDHYFLWRQQDAARTSLLMTARAHFSHQRLQGKSSSHLQDLLMREKGINWNDLPVGFKRGRFVQKTIERQNRDYRDKRTGKRKTADNVERQVWKTVEPPIFSADPAWLLAQISTMSSV